MEEWKSPENSQVGCERLSGESVCFCSSVRLTGPCSRGPESGRKVLSGKCRPTNRLRQALEGVPEFEK
jgi:hypothetical protein